MLSVSLVEQIKAEASDLGWLESGNSITEKAILLKDVLAIIEPLMAHLQPENRPNPHKWFYRRQVVEYFEELDKLMGSSK